MHAMMDLNNTKIQMRKEIKRAKVWVMSKLVRQIRSLESKKGDENMLTKNKRRAKRLEDELDIIKDLKPDDVFKQLINLPIVDEKTVKPQQTLQERAVIRIGSVSFIKNKITDIKSNVSAFHRLRSGKDMSTVDSELNAAVRLSSICQDVIEESKADDGSEHTTNLTNHSAVSNNSCPSDEVLRKISTNDDTINDAVSEPVSDDVCVPETPSESKVAMPIQDRTVEEVSDLKSFDKVSSPIVVPNDCAAARPNFQEMMEGYDDITQVLTNIGDGFNSEDDSGKGSDIELEDLMKPSGKDDSSPASQDTFFLNWTGTVKKHCEDGIKTGGSHASDDEGLKQIKSCFVESLADVSHQRNKGKNRPSQRARRRQATKDFANSQGDQRKAKSGRTFVNKGSAPTDMKVQPKKDAPLHPSWEASKKRKQEQNQLQEFKGKRVCFEDSD